MSVLVLLWFYHKNKTLPWYAHVAILFDTLVVIMNIMK
jgi:hypothetical protein